MDTTLQRTISYNTAHIEKRTGERPVFSAYEVGRTTITREVLLQQTGYDFSLPAEDQSPAEIFELYQNYPELDFLPVRDNSDWITGYLTRKMFLASLSESQFSRDLLFRKEARIHSLINRQIVCLNAHTNLSEASQLLMQRPDRMRFDPFVVTLGGHFFGISTVDLVIRGINYFLTREMEAVKDAQFRIIDATSAPRYLDSEFDSHILVEPLQGPGGDFAKLYEINEQYAIATLFDVCGKGVKAAAMVSVLGTLLHTMCRNLQKLQDFNLKLLDNELFRLNNDLIALSSSEMYATGIVALIDRQNYILSVFDYGHGMLWLRRRQKVHPLHNPRNDAGMPFLGITENLRSIPYSFRIKPGDTLLCCSDGIVEQMNQEHQMYGSIRVIEAFQIAGGDRLKDTGDQIIADWNEFRNGTRIRDDVSMMLFRID